MSNVNKTFTKEQIQRVIGKAESTEDQAMRAKTNTFIQAVRTEHLG